MNILKNIKNKYWYKWLKLLWVILTKIVPDRHVAIFLTNKCNSSCSQCYVDAKPQNNQVISDELLIEVVKKSKGFHINVFGGEPTLFMDKLQLIADEARKINQRISITTNGWWGYNQNIIDRIKNDIKPGMLAISLDEFHQEHVPIERILNIQKELKNTDIILTGGSASPNKKYKNHPDIKFCHFINYPLIEYGRAKKLPKHFFSAMGLNKIHRCRRADIVIRLDGKIGCECSCNVFDICSIKHINEVQHVKEVAACGYHPRFIIKSMPKPTLTHITQICERYGVCCIDEKWENKNLIGVITKNGYSEEIITKNI